MHVASNGHAASRVSTELYACIQVDLLPRGTSSGAAADWLQAAAANKRLSPISTCVVSSRTGQGIGAAAAAILRQRRGRDVYVMGAANVGKSAFIRCALLATSQRLHGTGARSSAPVVVAALACCCCCCLCCHRVGC